MEEGPAREVIVKKDNPVIVALDTGDERRGRELAELLRGEVDWVKVGLEAYVALGPPFVQELKEGGFKVFVDLKLHDIPNTVRGAVKGLVRQGADMLTLHLSGGGEMVKAAVEAAHEEASSLGGKSPLLVGVTLLTSLGSSFLAQIGYPLGMEKWVESLTALAVEEGLDGVVASAVEAARIRRLIGPEKIIVTPGIRMAGSKRNDQVRVATPAVAVREGADYIVVGREVTASKDPLAALRAVLEEVRNAGGRGGGGEVESS